jgi:hypothetical protein
MSHKIDSLKNQKAVNHFRTHRFFRTFAALYDYKQSKLVGKYRL